jgi:predicted aldo/keto reductase-like oxidoreductase
MGLGMMRFPSSQGYISNFIKEALSLGVTYIESCSFYIDYKCEELIGNALIDIPRNSYELAAKCCYKNELENLDFNNFFEQ